MNCSRRAQAARLSERTPSVACDTRVPLRLCVELIPNSLFAQEWGKFNKTNPSFFPSEPSLFTLELGVHIYQTEGSLGHSRTELFHLSVSSSMSTLTVSLYLHLLQKNLELDLFLCRNSNNQQATIVLLKAILGQLWTTARPQISKHSTKLSRYHPSIIKQRKEQSRCLMIPSSTDCVKVAKAAIKSNLFLPQ